MHLPPLLRLPAAALLTLLRHASTGLYYHLKGRKTRTQALRLFISENGLETVARDCDAERETHRYYRKFQYLNTAVLFSGLFDRTQNFDRVARRFTFIGDDIIEQYRGRGVIIMSYHIGPFTMIPLLMVMKKYDIAILARSDEVGLASRRTIDDINRYLSGFLASHGYGKAEFIDSTAKLSLVQIKKALKRKEFLIIYPDTVKQSSASWTPVPFFKQQIAGHVGLAKLVELTKADILRVLTHWDAQGGMVMKVFDRLPYAEGASQEETLRRIYGPLEGLVKTYLPQWIQVQSYEQLKY